MNDYKELIEELRNGYVLHENYNGEPEIIHRPSPTDKEAAAAIEQLMHERFLIGEVLVTASKWEIEPADALEKIRKVLRGEI